MAQDEKKAPRRRAVQSFLVADRTPIWMTLMVLLAGAAGTYYLAPLVNAEFEAQKIKTDFVIRNYGDLRTKMEAFQGLYGVVTQKLAAGQDVQDDVFKLQQIIGEVSAQNLSLLPMFTSAGGPKAAADVNAAMNAMMGVIFANAGKSVESDAEVAAYTAQVTAASQKLVTPLLELYVRIAEVGRLNPTEKDTDLPDR
ncbi:MAG TPA: hypothetical protein VGM83_11230 [Devosiaceae bacterium]